MILTKSEIELNLFKQQALQWAAMFDVSVCLNSNGFTDPYSKFETLIAVGVKDEIQCRSGNFFEQLAFFRQKHGAWVLGYFTYDLKNETESLTSENPDNLQFPELYFFAPQHILLIKNNTVEVISDEKEAILIAINKQKVKDLTAKKNINIQSRFTRQEYIKTIETIQQHIIRGDIYETNFCQEFYAENAIIDPLLIYTELSKISPSPFSCFFKLYNHNILSASPERFLAKRGNQLISQPIKGTAKRSADPTEDDALKQTLKHHPKEQQENVMIVDLVRNDLTRSAKPGTVKVDELFGIYTFEQVHQMISTILCEKDENISDIEAIKNTFPMGSMTGAPKINAMRLMEKYERTKRGVYSGAVGYFSPDGDFDFNVVIRTLLYNANNQYLSFQVGGAITHSSDPEKEYEECLLKAKAIFEVLGQAKKLLK